MKRTLAALSMAAVFCSGCLSVCRIPMPGKELYSDEGVCTNRVWTSLRAVVRRKHPEWRGWKASFPTVQARWLATKKTYFEKVDYSKLTHRQRHDLKWGKRLGWIWLSALWATAPLDLPCDIVCLPWDVYED